ncbi:hypothetical protein D3C73_1095980 [compost metagenome]
MNIGITWVRQARLKQPAPPLSAVILMQEAVVNKVGRMLERTRAAQQLRAADGKHMQALQWPPPETLPRRSVVEHGDIGPAPVHLADVVGSNDAQMNVRMFCTKGEQLRHQPGRAKNRFRGNGQDFRRRFLEVRFGNLSHPFGDLAYAAGYRAL